MSRTVTSKKCGKASWKGYGAHVEQVLGDVSPYQRCQCSEATVPAAKLKSWFSR